MSYVEKTTGGGQINPPPPAGIGLMKSKRFFQTFRLDLELTFFKCCGHGQFRYEFVAALILEFVAALILEFVAALILELKWFAW